MKKFIIVMILFSGLQLFSQDKVITSEEDYNYLTKGYREVVEKGIDVKAGYEVVKFYEYAKEDYVFSFYNYNQLSSKKTKAILIVGKKIKDGKDKVVYNCLPFNNKKLFKRYINDSGNVAISMEAYMRQLSFYLLAKSLDIIANDDCKSDFNKIDQ